MWVVCQADDLFVCFGEKTNMGFGLEISDETGSGGGKTGSREARGAVGKGTQRESVGEERRREAVDNGLQKEAVRKTVKVELAFLVAFGEVSRKIHSRR